MLSLAVTPAQTLLGWRWAQPLRRRFGLYAFGYVTLHFLTFLVLDYFFFLAPDNSFDAELLRSAIAEKPYVLVGLTAFLLLVPLAVTSTKGWMRRLGKRWTRLHRAVYLAAALAVIHYVWVVKSDIRQPLAFGALLALLLLLRWTPVRRAIAQRRRQSRAPVAHPQDRLTDQASLAPRR